MKPPWTVQVEAQRAERIVVDDAPVAASTNASISAVAGSTLSKYQHSGPKRLGIYCATWFAAFGAIAAVVWYCGAVYLYEHPSPLFSTYTSVRDSFGAYTELWFALLGASAAFLPGLIVGPRITRAKTNQVLALVLWGAVITELSLLMFVVATFGYVTVQYVTHQPSEVFRSFGELVAAFGKYAIEFWWHCNVYSWFVTFPAGLLCSFVIQKRGTLATRPLGCKLHGYREGGDK